MTGARGREGGEALRGRHSLAPPLLAAAATFPLRSLPPARASRVLLTDTVPRPSLGVDSLQTSFGGSTEERETRSPTLLELGSQASRPGPRALTPLATLATDPLASREPGPDPLSDIFP